MGVPRQLPPPPGGTGHGPFGEKAFKRALVGCVVLIALGVTMAVLGGEGPRAVGTSFAVLGGVGLLTAGALLGLERLVGRRPPPPEEVRRGNGHRR